MNVLKVLLLKNMKKSFNRTAFHQVVYNTCILLFAFLLSFPLNGTNIITGLLLLNWFFEGNLKNKIYTLKKNHIALLAISVFLIYAAGLLISDDLLLGFKIIEVKVSLVLLTLVISTSKTSSRLFDWILISFAAGLLVKTISADLLLYLNHFVHNDSYLFFLQGHFRDYYTNYSGIHPTYLSFYLLFSVCGIAYLIHKHKNSISRLTISIGILIILYFIFLSIILSARMPLISFTLVGSLVAVRYLINHRKHLILITGVVSLLVIGTLIIDNPSLNLRFREIKETSLAPPQGIYHNSTNIRVAILSCALSALEENLIIGLGTGDVQAFLNSCYEERNYSDILYKDSYGLHNAYLDIWISTGIVGFIILCLLFYKIIAHSVVYRQNLYFIFLLTFSICCLTEAMLNRNKGIAFFSYFNAILAFTPKTTVPKNKSTVPLNNQII